jgi:hypothetical protein
MISSDFEAVELYSVVIEMTRVPFIRASVKKCASGILVEIQFIPQRIATFEYSTLARSKSMVCWPHTIGCPGGRSVCQL